MDIITRKHAQEHNLPKYYDGSPCKHGHLSERYTKGQQCLECCLIRSTKRWENNKHEVKQTMKRYRQRIKQDFPLSTHLSYIRHRCKANGTECTITEEDIVIPEKCPILGIPLVRSKRGFQDSSPAVDRIDSTKGYVPGNVHVISTRANRLKSDATVDELLAIANYIKQLTR